MLRFVVTAFEDVPDDPEAVVVSAIAVELELVPSPMVPLRVIPARIALRFEKWYLAAIEVP